MTKPIIDDQLRSKIDWSKFSPIICGGAKVPGNWFRKKFQNHTSNYAIATTGISNLNMN